MWRIAWRYKNDYSADAVHYDKPVFDTLIACEDMCVAYNEQAEVLHNGMVYHWPNEVKEMETVKRQTNSAWSSSNELRPARAIG